MQDFGTNPAAADGRPQAGSLGGCPRQRTEAAAGTGMWGVRSNQRAKLTGHRGRAFCPWNWPAGRRQELERRTHALSDQLRPNLPTKDLCQQRRHRVAFVDAAPPSGCP